MIRWDRPSTVRMLETTFPAPTENLLGEQRMNPYHDENGQFTDAAGAVSSAESAASSYASQIGDSKDGWVASAKESGYWGSDVSNVATSLDRAEELLTDASSYLGDASYSLDSQAGDPEMTQSIASSLYDANIALGSAGNMLDSVMQTLAGDAPDDLRQLRDDVKALGESVKTSYENAAEESGYKPYG